MGLLVACKLCVGIFAFMVGYGYAFSKQKDFRYSLTHIWKLLLPFWVILVGFTVPVWLYQTDGSSCDWGLLVLNLFGINSELNWFSWFVAFYIFAMCVMPFVARLIDKSPLFWSAFWVFLFYAGEVALHELYPAYTENDWTQRLFDCCSTMPGAILGYLFARKRWFEAVRLPRTIVTPLLALLMMTAVLLARSYVGSVAGFNLHFIYAPLFIFCILIVFNYFPRGRVHKAFAALGSASVYMWFFHALFFNHITRSVYSPFVTLSDSFFLTSLWVVVLTYICSWCIMTAVGSIESKLSKAVAGNEFLKRVSIRLNPRL